MASLPRTSGERTDEAMADTEGVLLDDRTPRPGKVKQIESESELSSVPSSPLQKLVKKGTTSPDNLPTTSRRASTSSTSTIKGKEPASRLNERNRFEHTLTTTPSPKRRGRSSPSLAPTEYSDRDLEDLESPSYGRGMAYSPTNDDMKVVDWRVKGRFLEYRIELASDVVGTSPRWARGQHLNGELWKNRIIHFFKEYPMQDLKFDAVLGHDHGEGQIPSNFQPRVYKCGADSRRTLIFYTSDEDSDIGDKYDRHEGSKLDKAVWQEAIALYWRQRLYRIELLQVDHLRSQVDAPSSARSIDPGDCSSKIVTVDDGDEGETSIAMVLAAAIEDVEKV